MQFWKLKINKRKVHNNLHYGAQLTKSAKAQQAGQLYITV